jgi:maltose alpha-D-glucosyltransferase/alpha-amylase
VATPDHNGYADWYKDAIIYELHVKAFYDSTGDGRGDFRGLVQKLDYIRDLGVTAVWLLPFYPSPLRDDGYDISDYRSVHPEYGTLRDFKAFVREAHRRGLRVITELVVNHTSDQHPWFQAARRARAGSARRDFYVWSDTDQKFRETRIIFRDTESSNWAWDPVAKAYYWHRFFSHQPDLNMNNPQVVRAVGRVLRFWLDIGVDGLRLDAVPYLCVREGTNNENLPETHAVIHEMRRLVDDHYDDRMLLAEANQWPEDVRPYFGDGDECHMAFHFPLMPRIFMAVRQEDRRPITEIVERTPPIPDACQWALFLRNHDELTLEMVTDQERDYMYREYARDQRMRLNLGIRRRLAPLLDNSRRRIELLNSLLLSFPGTPVIYYGDELGMGDNVWLGDRDGVRTPMQWSPDRNGGFSKADAARLYLPVLMDPVYGHQTINVEAQERNPSSLLHFMRRIMALRRQHKAFGRGTMELLHPRNRKVLAYLRQWRNETILVVANLSRFAQPCELDLAAFQGRTPLEMFGHTEFPPIGELPYFLTLGAHAFYWFRLERQAEPIRVRRSAGIDLARLPALTVENGLDTLMGPDYRYTLANDVIAPWLHRQRWFQGKAREPVAAALADSAKLGAGFWLAFADVAYADEGHETYTLLLKVSLREPAERITREVPASVLARIGTPEGAGVLYDALADRLSCTTLFEAIAEGRAYRTAEEGGVQAFSTGAFERAGPPGPDAGVRWLGVEQSNTSVVLDNAWILKFFRRLEDGPNPDMEVGRYLTERTSFTQMAQVGGGLEYLRPGRPATAVAMLQAFVPNRGDGWAYFLELFREFVAAGVGQPTAGPAWALPEVGWTALVAARPPGPVGERLRTALDAARVLGRRTAEFHGALAAGTRDPAFAPAAFESEELMGRAGEMAREAGATLDLLGQRLSLLPASVLERAHAVLAASDALLVRFRRLERLRARVPRIRIHGDYHLGQVLRVNEDFVLTDFEGEPLRPLAERRRKECPLIDVAGMLRSFSYAIHVAARERAAGSEERGAVPEPWLRAGDRALAGAFLGAYLDAAGGVPFLPGSDAIDLLLDAFVLQKAFYELGYELNNRPDWVAIPLDGILALATRGSEPMGDHA